MHEDLDNYIFGFSISILYILGAIKIDSPYYILLSALLLGVMFLMKVYSSSFMEKIGLEVSDKVSEPLIKTTAIAVNFFILFFLLSRLFDFQLLRDVTYRVFSFASMYFFILINVKFINSVDDVPILEGVSEEEFKVVFPKIVKVMTGITVVAGVVKFILKIF